MQDIARTVFSWPGSLLLEFRLRPHAALTYRVSKIAPTLPGSQSPLNSEMRQRKYTTAERRDCQLNCKSIIRSCTSRKTAGLFFRGVSHGGHGFRRDRGDVHVLPRFGVAQLLPRLFLNGLLIALEAMNLLGIAVVLLLYLDDLLAQRLVFDTFLLVDHHSIRAEHNMDKQ